MRADRLIAALLFLQTRGKVTAAQLAEELEVSERTARRDLEALAMSGVPVYSRHGRGGGWELVGGARTDLSGLSAEEARAVFLMAGPAMGPSSSAELRSAMRKLTLALPETFRAEVAAAATAVKIDASGWSRIGPASAASGRGAGYGSAEGDAGAGPADRRSQGGPEEEPLKQLTDAVIAGRQVSMFYDSASTEPGARVVSPLGLVTKRNVWYLVANTERGTRTYRVSRISKVVVLDDEVERPDDFDLDAAWESIVISFEASYSGCRVEAWVDASMAAPVRWVFTGHRTLGYDAATKRLRMELGEVHEMALAANIAGFGQSIEPIEPSKELLAQLRRIARELAVSYLGD